MILYQHQISGADWLAVRKRAYLADPPRLGKTRTLIAAAARVGAARVLVIGPAASRTHWHREFEIMGWPQEQTTVFSFEQIVRGGEDMRRDLVSKHDLLIVDEAHNARSFDAKRTRLIFGRDGYARVMPIVWAASGTPFWKHPGNGWAALAAMWPGQMATHGLRTYRDFMDRFCEYWVDPNGWTHVRGAKNVAELQEILAPMMLRREWNEIGLDVPEVDWQEWALDVPAMVQSTLARLEDEPDLQFIHDLLSLDLPLGEGRGVDDVALATYRRLVGEAKAVAVAAAIAEELTTTEGKIVVFAYHRSVILSLRAALEPFGVVYVEGGISDKIRTAAVDAFQTQPSIRVFIGQITSTREAITLSAADRAVIVEPDWTANTNVQAGQRILAPGKHAQIQLVSLAGTLDEALVRRHVQETRMSAEIHGYEAHFLSRDLL
jgi:SWI/SNF-related matrix-associated actin-dependent regulator of chromatin subfamily A-like protein 1